MSSIVNHVGIGLRQPHYIEVLQTRPNVPWFEVHSENFFHKNSAPRIVLEEIRKYYPISLHCVGLSLGSADGLNTDHLQRVKETVEAIDPMLVSDHLSWSRYGAHHLPDLLPVPYTKEVMRVFEENISRVQETLNRQILIENPSSYVEVKDAEYREVDFLVELCRKTGSKILLDVNNVYVSSSNHEWDPETYIDAVPKDLVGEIHLAGHSTREVNGRTIRIDDHSQGVSDEVWGLFERAIKQLGSVPTLIEWDRDIPAFQVLKQQAEKAESIMRKYRGLYAVA